MSEEDELDPAPDNPKTLGEWSDQEVGKFAGAFSLDDFQLIKPKEGEEEGFVKVRIPDTVEPMAKGLIAAERKLVEAFEAPLKQASQETFSDYIRRVVNVVDASEEQEAGWRQQVIWPVDQIRHLKS